MSAEVVNLDQFRYEGKGSLFKCLLVTDKSWPDCVTYEHKTVFAQMEEFDSFKAHISELTKREVIEFRDFYNGNILSDLAWYGKGIKWFICVHDIVGEEEFRKMLYAKNRIGYCPFGAVSNIETFKELIGRYNVTGDIIRQLTQNNRTEEVNYIAEVMNLYA